MKPCGRSSNASGLPIDLDFAPSLWLRAGLLALQIPVLTAVCYLPGPISRSLGLVLALSSLLAAAKMPGIGWSRRALAGAMRHVDGTWTLIERGGRAIAAQLSEGRVAGTKVVFVTWVTPDEMRSAMVLPGMVDAAALRRLRALLLISRRP